MTGWLRIRICNQVEWYVYPLWHVMNQRINVNSFLSKINGGKRTLWHQIKQSLVIITLWVRTPLGRGVLDTTLCDKVCQWLAAGRWVSSTNKTQRHDIAEILLKVALKSEPIFSANGPVWEICQIKHCIYHRVTGKTIIFHGWSHVIE
jgi:hypothetical protein